MRRSRGGGEGEYEREERGSGSRESGGIGEKRSMKIGKGLERDGSTSSSNLEH